MSADDLRAAVEALRDEWANGQAVGYDRNEQVELDTEKAHARTLTALLAEHPAPERPAACEICLRVGCRGECRVVPAPEPPSVIDAAHLTHQREWSRATFGPGQRLGGVLDHIRKELTEVEENPQDVTEWADVLILAFDGAWRSGHEPQDVIDAIKAKQAKNEARTWPDWRGRSEDEAIEHVETESPSGGEVTADEVTLPELTAIVRNAVALADPAATARWMQDHLHVTRRADA